MGEKLAEGQSEKTGEIASPGIGQAEKQKTQDDRKEEASPQEASTPKMDGQSQQKEEKHGQESPAIIGRIHAQSKARVSKIEIVHGSGRFFAIAFITYLFSISSEYISSRN